MVLKISPTLLILYPTRPYPEGVYHVRGFEGDMLCTRLLNHLIVGKEMEPMALMISG